MWNMSWLPDLENGFITTHMPSQLREAEVRSLMEVEHGKWDEDVLHDILITEIYS